MFEDKYLCKRGHRCGTLNVRTARLHEEVTALDRRYQEAKASLEGQNLQELGSQFEQAVQQRAIAVINTHYGFVKNMVMGGEKYLNYYERKQEKIDDPPSRIANQNRQIVDGYAYAEYGRKLRFAAMAMDTRGLPSYGPVTMVLKSELVESRGSLLERNSYHFVTEHCCKAVGDSPFPFQQAPMGYRADWANRHRLALAKHAADLTPGMNSGDFDALILSPGEGGGSNARRHDRFVEIGIYDSFGMEGVREIHAPSKASNDENDDVLADAIEKMKENKVEWCWYDEN